MELILRLGSFLGMLLLMGTWEVLAPRRALTVSKARRWFCNLSIVVIDSAALRLLLPVPAIGIAVLSQERHWGLLNKAPVPYGLAFLLSLILLDLVIYLQHVVFHAAPLLWRVHRMHHSDRNLDVTSGLRFHPIEIVMSILIKMAVILLLGPPPVAVLTFEILLNVTSMFNHSNIYIPPIVDRVLRWLVVTPDMHRVHHSTIPQETDSNFGFNLPWWDRLFGTYRPRPQDGHKGVVIGLAQYQGEGPERLRWMLGNPFR